MIFKLLGIAGVLIAGAFGAYVGLHDKTSEVPSEGDTISIVIFEDTVLVNGGRATEEKPIPAGAEITSDETGRALLRFPDTSEVSVDPQTTLTLEENSYSKEDGGIVSRLKLTLGKVFLSIAELATPESRWEVETGNAVAVVRGTLFSVAFDGETSAIEVEEDAVSVAVLDPQTGNIIPETEVVVEEGNEVEVTEENVINASAPFVNPIEDKESASETEKINVEIPVEQSVEESVEVEAAQSVSAERLSLEIPDLGNVREGDQLSIRAIVHFSDGTKRDVTEEAKWRVLGPIGSVNQAGVFIAKLNADVQEFGSSSGAIVATWESEDGSPFLGQTEIFTVRVEIAETEDLRG